MFLFSRSTLLFVSPLSLNSSLRGRQFVENAPAIRFLLNHHLMSSKIITTPLEYRIENSQLNHVLKSKSNNNGGNPLNTKYAWFDLNERISGHCVINQTMVCPQFPTRDAEITDPSGTIGILVWDNHIQQIEDGGFYTLTNCKLKQYFGKRLATTLQTTVMPAEKEDISKVQATHNKPNRVCCPEIMNVSPSVYPICNNKDCRKK